ncbi:MAG: hypothetical protein J1F11_04645 [Oscillospiraceae bacterium]|nr:hypothetical protein [Oscillospiraceae bacterium]
MDGLELDSRVGNVYSKYSNKYYNTLEEKDDSSNYLDFDGYLKLLVAQMSNQDFNDPMSDSEMLQQMAQYSMLEGIKNMTQQTNISYASSLVGKVVTVSENGMYLTGRIDSVTIYNGQPYIIINGNAFKSSSVSDIVDEGKYAELQDYLGKAVEVTEDGKTVKGKVQNILFIGGEGYIAVNGNIYYLRNAKIIDDSELEDGGDEDGENVEGAEGEGGEGAEGVEGENGEGVEGVPGVEGDGELEESDTIGGEDDDIDETLVENSDVNTVAANEERLVTQSVPMSAIPGNNVSTRAQSLADVLMKEIDRVNLAAGAKEEDDEEEQHFNSYITQNADVIVPEYSAGILADSDILTMSAYENNYMASGSSDDNTVSRTEAINTMDNVKATYVRDENGNVRVVEDDDEITRDEFTDNSGNSTSAVSTSRYVDTSAADRYNSYLKAYSARRGTVRGVTTPKGVSTSDCTPHRISVEQYPEEAALADALGTRMYDIRFIHNTAITSRIKTGEVIGHTTSGKAITEIGYSGVGQLGEVVTFSDGTQRVEIMLKDGRSCWLHTSGKYTLDEICTTNGAPGSLKGLNPSESAIRHYARVIGEPGPAIKSQLGVS